MSSSARNEESSACISEADKLEMFDTFQSWAIKNYGDSGKTKTVTRKKYDRITNILSGEEQSSSENSKFRFWVKAKGFRLSCEIDHENDAPEPFLEVPSKTTTSSPQDNGFKRVAMVEDFFDIIYSVHVEMDGRGGKHAGQKRTYRAIAETYSFLPREAVTRFLMSCSDCQKRMHLSMENNNNSKQTTHQSEDSPVLKALNLPSVSDDHPLIDFSIPITQTYLNHMKNFGYFSDYSAQDDESMSTYDSEVSRERSESPRETETPNGHPELVKEQSVEEGQSMTPMDVTSPQGAGTGVMEDDRPLNMTNKSPEPDNKTEDKGHPERKRRASNESEDSVVTKASEGGTGDEVQGGKDDDDDDDNEDDDKLSKNYDPERLKAFNMFCRLFVDENLDRTVPISKQPKDKVQAILEACDRQFPEFHVRSRKRIRTYLKSCRRMRRTKEQNGWEPLRPTPPHLTSAAAESMLAQACDNESANAKRMRMGMEPLPARSMNVASVTPTTNTAVTQPQTTQSPKSNSNTNGNSGNSNSQAQSQIDRHVPASNDFIRQAPPPAFRAAPEFPSPFFTNGNGLFRPGFPGYQHPAHQHHTVLQHPVLQSSTVQNGEFGPTDLSMKKQNSKGQLSGTEVSTIKQLISGYRESAAFLYRSADELEQLLLHQN